VSAILADPSVAARASHLMRIYTVGHSTRPQPEFIALLAAHGVRRLGDVRTMPRSRHHPQFNSDLLAAALGDAGIEYVHLPALGGLRHTTPASVNLGWRNKSFRGYADYMQTGTFLKAIDELIALGSSAPTAIMCAEAVPWRCHRSLIADALVVRGIEAPEIASPGCAIPHALTSFARVDGTALTYPPEELPLEPGWTPKH
jgi:uncharacterized protein (DUF488 family)